MHHSGIHRRGWSWRVASASTAVAIVCAWGIGGRLEAAGPDSTGNKITTGMPDRTAETLRITVDEAILIALENNRELIVERLNPAIRQTEEDIEAAVFDPVLRAQIDAGREKGERLARSGSQTETFTADSGEAAIALEQYFPTGTTVSLEADLEITDSSLYADRFYDTRLGMTVSQALLRGFGSAVNRAQLMQARLDTRMSVFDLRGTVASLVATVEQTYWNYALARRQIEIVEASLSVARQQLAETGELITVGRLAKAELPAVQAEVAAQEQALIEARANEAVMRLKFLRLLNPPGPGLWDREIELIHAPTLPAIDPDAVDRHVAVALRLRPLLNAARLAVQKGDLQLVETRNGLLPLLDVFVTLGKSGYAQSFGDTVDHFSRDRYDAAAGLRFEFPPLNREARALHRQAQLSREQAEKALSNLIQLVDLDVRTAYIEVDRTRQQIAASSATRRFDEEKLRIETEKLRVGKSTSFLVAQAQRDLLASRIAEVRALINTINARVDLYRLDGSLLTRRGIAAPGSEPVEPPGRG